MHARAPPSSRCAALWGSRAAPNRKPERPRRSIDRNTNGGIFTTNEDRGGVLFQNSKIRLTDIPDGTANTLAVGECIYDEPTVKWAALWPGMIGLYQGGVMISCVMWDIDDLSAQINGTAPQAFGSRHGGGAYFVFCDGSVRFFREGGNIQLLKWLAGRNDGVIINPEF